VRSYNSVFFASRHRFNGTFPSASKTLICSHPFHSLTYVWTFLVNCGRRQSGRGRILYSFSPRSTSFSDLKSTGEEEQTDPDSDKTMDPYFEASYAKLGTSSCKKCKEKIEKGALRLAKVRYV